MRCRGGLRLGEVIGLRWSDVLLEERRLRVGARLWQKLASASRTPRSRARRGASPSALSSPKLLGAYFDEQVIEGGADADGYVWPPGVGESHSAPVRPASTSSAC